MNNLNTNDKLVRYDYALYVLHESLECDRETVAELTAKGEDGIYVAYLKGRINGYQDAISALAGLS